MRDGEIVHRYKQADNKKEQIQVLADLNACGVSKIQTILLENGVDLSAVEPKKKKTHGNSRSKRAPIDSKALKKLKDEMIAHGVTNVGLGKVIGVSGVQIGQYLSGKVNPTPEKFEKMKEVVMDCKNQKAVVKTASVKKVIARKEQEKKVSVDGLLAEETENLCLQAMPMPSCDDFQAMHEKQGDVGKIEPVEEKKVDIPEYVSSVLIEEMDSLQIMIDNHFEIIMQYTKDNNACIAKLNKIHAFLKQNHVDVKKYRYVGT